MGLADSLCFRHAQVAEDVGAAVVFGLVGHARHDMKMDVRMVGRFGELDDVGLDAAGGLFQGERDTPEQAAQLDRFLVAHFVDRGHVPRATSTSQPGSEVL